MKEDFEVAVERTLADLARVDVSTLDRTRSSIAALPDRNSTRARVGRSISGLGRWRPTFLAAGASVVVVAIVAISVFGRLQDGPVASGSPTTTIGSPTPARTLPTSSPAYPAPTALPTPAFRESLPVVMTGEDLHVLGWAPDGSSFAILEQPRGSAAAPAVPTVHMFDRAGVEEGSVETWWFGWLDATSYLAFRYETASDGTPAWHAYMGRIGSTQLTELTGTYDSLIAGPSGAVALLLPWDYTPETTPHYVVVSGGTISQPREGYPAAWSRDGTDLAVIHPTGPPPPRGAGSNTYGWLEVVRSTGASVASARDVQTDINAQVEFSPDGSRVAFRDDTNAFSSGEQIGVLNLGLGRLDRIPKFGLFTWASADQVLFVDLASSIPSENNHILSWSATTGQLTPYGIGDIVGASGQGTVITGTNGVNVATTLTWVSQSPSSPGSGTLIIGDGLWDGTDDAAWSPDGRSLVLISGDASSMSIVMDALLAVF
jgi:hypothetical protein